MKVEDAEGMTLREIELTRRIVLLERQLVDCEPEARRGGKNLKDLTLGVITAQVRPYFKGL